MATKPPATRPRKKRRAPAKTRPVQVQNKLNQLLALEMRLQGAVYSEIGDKLGLSPERANKLVLAALADVQSEIGINAARLRDMELMRMEGLWKAMFPLAKNGSPKAAMACLHISKRRAALLGLDQIKVELDVNVKGYRIAEASPDAFPPPPGEPGAVEVLGEAKQRGEPPVPDLDDSGRTPAAVYPGAPFEEEEAPPQPTAPAAPPEPEPAPPPPETEQDLAKQLLELMGNNDDDRRGR